MHDTVKVGAYVVIQEGCPLSHTTIGSDQAEITCGSATDSFQFLIEDEALREFVKVGTEALAEMDALFANEEAERNKSAICKLVSGEDCSA